MRQRVFWLRLLIFRMQDQHEQSEQPVQQAQEQEVDDEVSALSANPDKSSRSLKEQQYSLRPQPKGCCCFNTRCEFFLFLLITLLIFAAGYLIYDNRTQEGEISQILTILQKAQNQKHLTTTNNLTIPSSHENQAQQSATTTHATVVDVGPKVIPRKVWYFNHQDLIQSKQWTQLAFQRIKTTAQEEGFELSLINQASWPTFIPASRQQKLEGVLKSLSQVKIQGISGAKLDRIVRQLTVLEVLREQGGIFIEEDVVLTEKLEWVLESKPNQLVNAWQLVYPAGAPQVVGFYNPEQSSQQQKEPRTGAKEEAEQNIVRFPSLSSVFLAATPSNPFIIDLLEEYYAAVLNNNAFLGQLKRIHMEGAVGGEGQGLMAAACQLVLRKKQLQLQMDQIAVEYYRIAAINVNFGPAKLRFYLGDTQADKIFNHLSFVPHKELQYQFGIIRFCTQLAPMERLYGLVDQAIQSKTIVANSFLHQFLLGKHHAVLNVPEQTLSKKQWEALPGKLWVYLQGATYSTPFFTQLWMRHLQKAAAEAKFQLKILNEQNLEQHLSKETVAGISQALTTNKLTIYDYTKKQLISLAVLHEHGGVWVEPFVFFTEGLAWLRDISEKPFIWNRFGQLPRVVAAFHPHFGSPFHWTYKENGTRETWHLAYQNSLIAAQPHSQLIGDWFLQLKDNLQMDYASVMRKFEGCRIKDHKWISEQNHQLLSQDSIKCALGTRQLQLQVEGLHQSAPQYYGLWGLNGFAGLLKMREYTNFVAGRTMENPLIWRYSFQQMQDIVGNVSFCAKIYDPTANRIEQLLGENLGNPLRELHSQSFLMKLVGDSGDQVIRRDGRLYLEREWRAQQQSRSKMLEQDRANQLLANMPKIIWIFESIEIDRKEVFTKLMLTKVDSYAQMSGFEVRFVTDQNYKAWLNPASSSAKKLSNFLLRLSERVDRGDGNLKDHSQRIRGQAILLTLLYQNGGVFLTRKIAAHQDFSWIHKVETLDFINRAGKSQPQVFGFFSPGYSSPEVTLNGQAHVESPSLENFFLASGKKAEYVRDFLDEYMRVLEESKKVKERLRQLKYSFSWLRGDDPYYQCFFLASQFALHQKNEKLLTQNTTLNAIQYYGLYTLNTHYYPYRLHKYFSSFRSPAESVIKALTGSHLSELEAQVGPLKYFSILPPRTHEMAQFIEQATKGTAGSIILQGSFVHKFLMPTMAAGAKGVAKIEMMYDSAPPKGKWQALPRVVYVYLPEGLQRTSFGYQLMVAAMRKGVTSAGFQLKMVDNNNLQQYIDKVIIKKVNKLIVGDKEQYRSLIFRLAIVSKHGGVALLPETLLTEDFGWLVNIGGMDRRMLFNRHGENPKVLLSVDTLRTPAVNWTYNPQGQTKSGHSIGWSDALIAAEKDNELLKEWFEQLTTYFQLNPQELSQVFEECGIRKMQWSAVDPSRLGSDALVCILNRKKKELQSQKQPLDVCREYRLWGIGQSFGAVKMEDGLNLEQSSADLNPFLWRRERKEVEGTIGGIRPMVRLSERQVLQVGQMAREKRLGEWGKEGSLLMSQVSQVVKSELSEVKGELVIAM